MRVDLFDFELPEEQIALRPVTPRDAARMLVVHPHSGLERGAALEAGAEFEDRFVKDLPTFLNPGDVLVFNDTKVIPARLSARRHRGAGSAGLEVMLHQRVDADHWRAFIRPAKRVNIGERLQFGEEGRVCLLGELWATVQEKGDGGDVLLAFDFSGPILDEAIASLGSIPLPPYIASKRAEDEQDKEDYQTIFAHEEGAVAAPTAGLHFTENLFQALDNAGIERHFVTLHVGAGTFLPVKAEDTDAHQMHAEFGEISAQTAKALNAAKARGSRLVCVGTTSLRLLESAVQPSGEISAWCGATDIFITPGYRFQTADVLMTNFHLPRSTLFMLVSAFCGLETMQTAYKHAIQTGYRFYSYGDSSLLFRGDR